MQWSKQLSHNFRKKLQMTEKEILKTKIKGGQQSVNYIQLSFPVILEEYELIENLTKIKFVSYR